MKFIKTCFIITIGFSAAVRSNAQNPDTIAIATAGKPVAENFQNIRLPVVEKRVGVRPYIVPGILIVYGFASLGVDQLKSFNGKVKKEVWTENPHSTTSMDDYLRFAPAVAVYGLNAVGIKGLNNLRDRSMILVLSNTLVCGATFGLKQLTHELRPDGSDYYSFPSGHTAAAFASAEFMRQEYKHISPWYGVAGYVAAGATGMLRMYNNRHWVSDVLAGAGVGIASTKLAYWIYPAIKRKLFKDKPMNTMVMPYYQPGGAGLAMVYRFR